MELLIGLLVIVAVVFAVVRLRRTFRHEVDRGKRIKRANDHGKE